MSKFDGFVETDETIKITLPKVEFGKVYSEKQVEIALYRPEVNDGSGDIPKERFVPVVLSAIIDSPGIYIKSTEFEKRFQGNDDSRRAIYDEDAKSKFLACEAWDEDGNSLDDSDRPRGLVVSPEPSETKLARQTVTWRSIASAALPSTRRGAPRLWHPADPPKPPLKLFIAPLGSSLPTMAFKEAIEIAKEKTAKDTWIEWKEAPKDFDKGKHVLLSQSLLGYYASYMPLEDFKRLVLLQTSATEPKPNEDSPWRRRWPTLAELNKVEKELKVPSTGKNKEPLVNTELMTNLATRRSNPKRQSPNNFMGGSANEIGQQWWETTGKQIAEWLHRSAFSLGSNMYYNHPEAGLIENKKLVDTRGNIVFGSYEANSDMTRAEKAIRDMGSYDNKFKGLLTTRIVNKFESANELVDIGYKTGEPKAWSIDKEIQDQSFTWFAPKLEYSGRIELPKFRKTRHFSTSFYPFSRQQPLNVEGTLDSCMLTAEIDLFFEEYESTKSSVPATKKLKPDTLVSHVSSSAMPDPTHILETAPVLPVPRSTHLFSQPILRRISEPALPRVLPSQRLDGDPGDEHPVRIHPKHLSTWSSIRSKSNQLKIGHLVVDNPRLVGPDRDMQTEQHLPPSTGFMLAGDIKLFGLENHHVSLTSWHGPPPKGVRLGSEVPVFQSVSIASISPVDFIPPLKGTEFEGFTLENVDILYQSVPFVTTKPVGWSVTANIPINANHGAVHRVMRRLGIENDQIVLQGSAFLGYEQDWTRLPDIFNFVVEGVLQVIPNNPTHEKAKGIRLCDGVYLTRVGASLTGLGQLTHGMDSQHSMKYGYDIFGQLNVEIPGSVTPLEFDFGLSEFGGLIQLVAQLNGDIWENAFGTGLNLSQVQLKTSFVVDSPSQSLELSISAMFEAGSASAFINGTYQPGLGFSLSAEVENLGVQGIVDLFKHATGNDLHLPSSFEVSIGKASIEISREHGLQITVDQVKFEKYTAANATIKLGADGVYIQGSIQDVPLSQIPSLKLVSAFMRISFERLGSKKSTDVTLGGNIQYSHLGASFTISADVHFYKSPSSGRMEWTVYGSFDALGSRTTLGKLFPHCQGTFLSGFAINDLLFAYASQEDPVIDSLNPQKYPIKKGLQICAIMGEVAPLNRLLRTNSFPGLILSASWNSDNFLLDLILPTDTMVHLGNGIRTDPITLSIDMSPGNFFLQLGTGVKVPVPKSTTLLDFQADLTLKDTQAILTGRMVGTWVDPFGVSNEVSIGPGLELGVGINLATLFEISYFEFSGSLQVGKASGDLKVEINDDSDKELLAGAIRNVGIRDIVKFARKIIHLNIPIPPDFLVVHVIDVYFSTGVTINGQVYPAGFSFDASMSLFGKGISAQAAVSGGSVHLGAEIDDMIIGPLHISGRKSKNATLDLILGATRQHLNVDGAIKILGLDIELTLLLELLPHPAFSFDFELKFTDLLLFIVQAKMIGDVKNLNDLSGLDFQIHAVFEQHILDYVREQVIAALEKFKSKANADINAAEADVDKAEKILQEGIDTAQKHLDKTYQSWLQHSKAVHANMSQVITTNSHHMQDLQNKVKQEKASYDKKMQAAEAKVRDANAHRAAKMREAETMVTKAKAKWDADVASETAKLEAAKKNVNEKFGVAEERIKEAEAKVDQVQGEIDETKSKINWCESVSFWTHPGAKFDLAYYEPKLGVLEGYKWTADKALELANNILKGTDYVTAKTAIPALEGAVKEAGIAGDHGFKLAQATLHGVDVTTGALVHEAEKGLEDVQKLGDGALVLAQKAVKDFAIVEKTALQVAQTAIDDLSRSAEWLAYQTASGGLTLAKHSTHVLDVAKAVLNTTEAGLDGIVNLAENDVKAALETFNVTKIELDAELRGFLGEVKGAKFKAAVTMELFEKPVSFSIELEMSDEGKGNFIVDILKQLVKEITHKGK